MPQTPRLILSSYLTGLPTRLSHSDPTDREPHRLFPIRLADSPATLRPHHFIPTDHFHAAVHRQTCHRGKYNTQCSQQFPTETEPFHVDKCPLFEVEPSNALDTDSLADWAVQYIVRQQFSSNKSQWVL